MPSLRELSKDQLTTARTATDSVFKLKAYLPGNVLAMLLGRWISASEYQALTVNQNGDMS